MKLKMKLLGSIMTLMTLFLAPFGARAIVLLQDNFSEYANGPLGTNTPTWFSPPSDPTYATNTEISVSSGSVVINYAGSASVQTWALFTNGIPGYTISLPSSGPGSAITNISGTYYYFPSNGPVAALYSSFNMNVSSAFLSNSTGDYFAMFLGTNFLLHPRVYICTNSATPGFYRLEINNNSSPSGGTNGIEVVSQDLTYGTTYSVVFKQVLATGLSTLWVGPTFPANETVSSTNFAVSPTAAQSSVTLGSGITLADTTGTNVPSFTALCGFGFHTGSGYGTGAITINNLICGTSFADVVPATDGSNPPFITIQPAGVTNYTGATVTLSVVAGGDQDTMTYQWYGPSGLIGGATSSNYTITPLGAGNAGGYYVVVANAANPSGVTSSTATVGDLSGSAMPTISSGPSSTSTTFGSSATFTVTATDGGAPMTYQWYGPSGIITNQTNSSLSLLSVVYGQAGNYSVKVSNFNGTTTSSNGVLTINAPTVQTIAYIRSLLDNTNFNTNGTTALFTIKGTNNTWENQTTAGNSEFNLQDGTGGMNIFWSGAAASTNFPPAGAVLTITAPLSEFDGILEMEPVYGNAFHSVVTNITNGPLPVPQPLPFDPNMVGNPTNMQKHLMSQYFVASNVFLDLSTGPTFGDDAAEPLTNGNAYVYNLTFSNPSTATNQTVVTNFTVGVTNAVGQTNVMFYNDHVINFIGGTKPIGPCTIYGILSIHVTATPYTSGYEFVATRLSDIIPALLFTNTISHIVRYGDLATNTFTQNVLQPSETLSMYVVATDPGGGTVTLGTPTGNGTWSAITGNGTHTASATYTYTGTSGAAGTTDTPTLPATFSSSGFNSTYTWSIYVPTVQEQSVRITEVLPYSSSNTNSPAYNPLLRPLPESNSVSYDQYVEFVNGSGSSLGINHWTVGNGSTALHEFTGGESLGSSNCAVVYGGPLTDPDQPTITGAAYVEAASTGNGLTLTAASGVITLLNNAGNLVDRVAYPAAGSAVLNTNFTPVGQSSSNYPVCSYSRFPTLNSPLVPQPFISTNYVTPGAQYDGGLWSSPTQVPAAVGPISTTAAGGTVNLTFTANPADTTTLWLGNSLLLPFSVLTGGVFSNTSGSFTISNTPANYQFYFITTEAPGGGGPMGGD